MSAVDLWGESIALVPDGYDAQAAQAALDQVIAAVARLARRAAALERMAGSQDVLQGWMTAQAEALRAPAELPPPSDEATLRQLVLESHAEIDRLLGELRQAGVPERALTELGAQGLTRLRSAVFTADPLDLDIAIPEDAVPGTVPPPATRRSALDEETPPSTTVAVADVAATTVPQESVAAPAPAPAPAPATAAVAPEAPPVQAVPAGEQPGPVLITLAPIDSVDALRQAQEILAQFSDTLVIREVRPDDAGATFVTDVFAPSPLAQRFGRIPGVAGVQEPAPGTLMVQLDPGTPVQGTGPGGVYTGRLGGLRTSPHGPATPGLN